MFDVAAKRLQKNRAAASEDVDMYDYLRNEVRCSYLNLSPSFLSLFSPLPSYIYIERERESVCGREGGREGGREVAIIAQCCAWVFSAQ